MRIEDVSLTMICATLKQLFLERRDLPLCVLERLMKPSLLRLELTFFQRPRAWSLKMPPLKLERAHGDPSRHGDSSNTELFRVGRNAIEAHGFNRHLTEIEYL